MSDPRLKSSRVSGVLCALALCCILIAGLLPFGRPRNNVAWLGDRPGIRFAHHGTILSTGPFAAGDHACTLEMWLRPSRSGFDGTLLAFYALSGSERLSLHQSLTDLKVDWMAPSGAPTKFYANDVFRGGQPVFLTIVFGPREADLFMDGILVRQVSFQNLRSSRPVCEGNPVVGDSSRSSNSWDGEFHGLAIYQRDFTPEQAMTDYRSWVNNGRPGERALGKPQALYLFTENGGRTVRDHGTSGVNLDIPERYAIARQVLLESPWSAFEPTRAYVNDILINIGGFMPFGFTLAAFLSARGQRTTAFAVLAGFMVSLMIETLQAYLPTRDSDLTDVMTNTLGAWLGAMLYGKWLARPLRIFAWMR